jgi:NADH:ubiquinone oxidoreductase subunit 6 (subunit J)
MVLNLLLALCAIVCAIQAIRTTRLLPSALWLAGTSALVSLMMYLMGAYQVAVIELSVGAGLVTVLFVFAINIASEDQSPQTPLLPTWLGVALALVVFGLLAWLTLPLTGLSLPVSAETFTTVFWQARGMDVLVQIALIFAAVLGVLGLLSEPHLFGKTEHAAAQPPEEVQA